MPPERLDSLDKDSLKPLVLQLLAQNKSLLERIDTLLARIAELEGRAGKPPKTPTNSSLPPSTGQKANVSETPRKRKGRMGRPGVTRTLAENPDATRDVYRHMRLRHSAFRRRPAGRVRLRPHRAAARDDPHSPARRCGASLRDDGHCPCCKRRIAASPPADMAPGSPFGPGIVALVTYLHACQMVSYSRMTEVR
jgi:transposase